MKNIFKKKKFYIVLSILILLGIAYAQFPLKKVYFYSRGDDSSISNQPIHIQIGVFCVESACSGKKDRIYEGYTGKDGSFRLPLKDILGLKNKLKSSYSAVNLHIPNFTSTTHSITPDKINPFHIYLTEKKDAKKPMQIELGQELNVATYLSHNHYILQLNSIDQVNKTIELSLLLSSSGNDTIIQKFTLKKDIPSYIPRDITDTQLILTEVKENQVILNLLLKASTQAWAEREIDFSPELSSKDPRYKAAVDRLKKVETKYKSYSGGKTVKLVPYNYSHAELKAIAPLDEEWKDCIKTSIDLDSSESSSKIAPCIHNDQGVQSPEEIRLDF